jgi:hypothetical protein
VFNLPINTSVKIAVMYKYTFCLGTAVIYLLLGTAIDNRMAMANDSQSSIASNFKSQKDVGTINLHTIQSPITNSDSTLILSVEAMAISTQRRNEISHALNGYYEAIQGSLRIQVNRL